MMTKLTLTNYALGNTTVLENEFIDHYMAKANGEYVKVYLLLLRHMNGPGQAASVSGIADLLECTEKDVQRALKYWKKQGLLDYSDQQEADSRTVSPKASGAAGRNDIADLTDMTEAVPTSVPNIQQYRERKEFKELLFVAEQYLGKTLSATDIDTITYFYDTLHMPAELIEYLIEYCVENGHKSMHYIRKVALSWNDQKITTVSEAKSNTVLYNKNCYSVLNAYGIKGRAPAPSEITYMKRWSEEYGFSLELILEACDRTMKAIHQPNFEYTETILKSWQEKGVHHRKDIDALDASYLKEKEQKKKLAVKPAAEVKSNKFNNFSGRSYDMDALERKLVHH